MATIQVSDVPDDVAEIYRRRAQAAGKSLQSYMREQLIAMARPRDETEVMALTAQTLAGDPAPIVVVGDPGAGGVLPVRGLTTSG